MDNPLVFFKRLIEPFHFIAHCLVFRPLLSKAIKMRFGKSLLILKLRSAYGPPTNTEAPIIVTCDFKMIF